MGQLGLKLVPGMGQLGLRMVPRVSRDPVGGPSLALHVSLHPTHGRLCPLQILSLVLSHALSVVRVPLILSGSLSYSSPLPPRGGAACAHRDLQGLSEGVLPAWPELQAPHACMYACMNACALVHARGSPHRSASRERGRGEMGVL